ncbi:MAG TPA: hypothetical protein VNN17_13375 [Terriglobia bacterium]|nr:hypothetical protein [Terriglobia bacterium]
MSITPSSVPGPSEPGPSNTAAASAAGASRPSHTPLIALAAVVVIGFGALFFYTRSISNRLEQTQASLQAMLENQGKSLAEVADRLEQTQSLQSKLQNEVGATKETLSSTQAALQRTRQTAAELAKQQEAAKQELASRLGQLAEQQEVTQGNLGSLSSDVSGVKGEVKLTQSELEATKSELKRVIGDLGAQSDLIAHTRADLQALRQRGERDYFEFDLRKAAKRQKVGTLQLELRSTDVKRQKYTVHLIADDRVIEKKDKTVFEPVQFYQVGYRQPTEIVVQQIFKDRITGYISVPKVRDAQTAALAQ